MDFALNCLMSRLIRNIKSIDGPRALFAVQLIKAIHIKVHLHWTKANARATSLSDLSLGNSMGCSFWMGAMIKAFLPPVNEVAGRWCFQLCLSFCSRMGPCTVPRRPLYVGPWPWPQDMFNLDHTGQPPPKRTRTCTLKLVHCEAVTVGKRGGWHSTQMPSCLYFAFAFVQCECTLSFKIDK